MISVSTELAAELARTDGARERFFLQAEFRSPAGAIEYLRCHTGIGTLTLGGNSFIGVLDAIVISEVVSSTQESAEGFTVRVMGSADIVQRAMTYSYQGRPVTVWEGYLNNAGALVDAMIVAAGLMDTMSIDHSGTAVEIEVKVDSLFTEFTRPKRTMLSPHAQRAAYPDDDTMDMLPMLDGLEFPFPKSSYFRT